MTSHDSNAKKLLAIADRLSELTSNACEVQHNLEQFLEQLAEMRWTTCLRLNRRLPGICIMHPVINAPQP